MSSSSSASAINRFITRETSVEEQQDRTASNRQAQTQATRETDTRPSPEHTRKCPTLDMLLNKINIDVSKLFKSEEPQQTQYCGEVVSKFKGQVKQDFDAIGKALKQCYEDDRKNLEKLGGFEANLPMAALIAAVSSAAGKQGIHAGLNTPSLEAMFKDARRACELTGNKNGMKLPAALTLRADSTASLLKDQFADTPVGEIPEKYRWQMMGIDYCRLDVLKKWFAETPALKDLNIDVDNFTFGFLFDADQGYLSGMTQAMFWAMLNAKDKDAFPDLEQLKNLHRLATERDPGIKSGEIFDGVEDGAYCNEVTFRMRQGQTLTEDGLKELNAFYDELKAHADEPERIGIREAKGDYIAVGRGGISKATLEKLASEHFDTYRKQIEEAKNIADPQERSDTCIKALIDLCQWLERAHLFENGNCRISCHVLLNQELARLGEAIALPQEEPLSLFDDINKFDGHSREEIFKLLREGQERYKSLCATEDATA
jgi:hypothetical protein